MKNFKTFAINIILFFLFCGATELFFTIYQKDDPVLGTFKWSEAFTLAHDYGPHLQTFGEKFYPKLEIGNNYYANFDKDFSRIVPHKNPEADTRVFFLGCSYTFGVGLPDDQSMPNYFAKYTKKTRAINMGIPGMGPSESAHFMNVIPLGEKEFKNNIAIFNFFPDHFNRVANTWSHLWWSEPTITIQYFNEDGSLTGGGFLPHENYPLYLANLFLKTSETLRFLANKNPKGPKQTTFDEDDMILTFMVIKRIEEIFKKRVPNGKFFLFVLGPELDKDWITPLAKRFNINVLNPYRTFLTDKFQPDAHYNAQGNQEFARAIIESLKEKGIYLDD